MSNFFGTAFSGTPSSVVYDGPVYEGYNVNHGGEFAIAMESAEDQVGIIAALAELDVQASNYVAESMAAGEEGYAYVAESFEPVLEAAGGNVIEKIKAAIKSLWGKVRAFFASILRTLDGLTKSTEDFVKKYGKQIEKLNLPGFKYEMHDYTVEALPLSYKTSTISTQDAAMAKIVGTIGAMRTQAVQDSALENIDKEIEKLRDDREDTLESYRAEIIGASGKLDAEEFRKEVRKKLRGGKEDNEKEEISVNVHKIMADVKGTSKIKTAIDKVQKEADKHFGEAIKMVDKLAQAANKASAGKTAADRKVEYTASSGAKTGQVFSSGVASKAATVANIISSTLSAQQGIVNTAVSEWNAAVKERDGVYKKVLMKAFSHKAEN